jgi:hypothetical protein
VSLTAGEGARASIHVRRAEAADAAEHFVAVALARPPGLLVASLLMWGLCRSAPSAVRVSFASKSNHAVLALRAYNLKGEP